ncbi:MAG: chloride channel protein [Planctomycetota bacterium]|nr:chloride channel protein [Planctomycetota bacterium]
MLNPQRLFERLSALVQRLGFRAEWYLVFLAAVIGTLTGFGAVGFTKGLAAFEHFVVGLSRGNMVIGLLALPVVGMFLAGVLIVNFAPDAKGHGVPQVLKALISKGGVIKARIGAVKVVASILTVGSGGSAGTEGPIVQIGAVIGSVGGQWLRISREHMQTLVGCGAAAGISSVFNAPIAGVFFVLEILLRDFSLKTFTPIVVASVFSAVATQRLLGENTAIFTVDMNIHDYQFVWVELPSYILLGAVCGLVAVWFNKLLHKGEDLYDAWKVPALIKTVSGGVGVGLLGLGFVLLERNFFADLLGHGEVPAFYGNGYSTIHLLLDPNAYHLESGTQAMLLMTVLLIGLVLLKGVATTFTLASGGSGGVFAPSLFLGATTGAALGQLLESMGLIPAGSTPASYALVGMAAVVAGATHAPLTAILILFEMTRNIYVVLPIMLAAVIATAVAQIIERDSIYTFGLRRAGFTIGGARDLTVMRRVPVAACSLAPLPPEPIFASDPLSKLITLHAHHHVPDFVVVEQDSGKYIGMVTSADIRTALIDREAIPLLLVAEVMRTDLPTVHRDETLDTVMDKFARHDVASLAVVSPIDEHLPMAILTRAKVMQRYKEALEDS